MSDEFVPYLKGDLDARQHRIYNLPDPVDNNEVATKAYVDAGGGSQAVKIVRVPLAHNTPNLVLTGVAVYTPAADEVIFQYGSALTYGTPWNGTTPVLHFGYAADLAAYDVAFGNAIDLTAAVSDLVHADTAATAGIPSGFGLRFKDATPMTLMVDDGNGGDPGSTVGDLTLVLSIVAAA